MIVEPCMKTVARRTFLETHRMGVDFSISPRSKASLVSTLGRKAVSGVFWTAGLNVFRDFVQFGVMLVLVRLIAPESYGKFALVMAIMTFLNVLSHRVFLEYTLQ